jgi:hypothetical protein
MKRIYICAPYRGDIETNRSRALGYVRYAKDTGNLPFCPHLYFDQFCDEATERDLILDYCCIEIIKCDEVWVFGDEITAGMTEELRIAKAMHIRITYPLLPEKFKVMS